MTILEYENLVKEHCKSITSGSERNRKKSFYMSKTIGWGDDKLDLIAELYDLKPSKQKTFNTKLDIEQFIVDCIETYRRNRNIDRTIVNTIFDGCLEKQGFKIKDHKLIKIENYERN